MEKKNINLIAVQLGSRIGCIDENIHKAKVLLENVLSKNKADFVFLPEVWTCGWDCKSFPKCSEKLESAKSIKLLTQIAQKYHTNIIGGSIIEEKNNGTLTNTCPVIDRNGNLVCTYEKNHLFSYYGDNEGNYIKQGENPVMVALDGVNIGLSICYDIRFPELYRAYRKSSADILVNVAAWGKHKKIPWDCMTASRAIENQTYFVALTQTGELLDGNKNLGHSMIYDYNGNILDEIDTVEGYVKAKINLNEMYDFRNKCTILKDIKKSYEVIKK